MVGKRTLGEKAFDVFNYIFLFALMLVIFYPCYYIVVASVSDPVQIYESNSLLWHPKGFSLYSYSEVLQNAHIWRGYRNTILYVVSGTFLSVFLTTTAAFALTRKNMPGNTVILFMILFTMYFSGGLIPTYLVVRGLNLTDTPLALILPNAVVTYNLIITISYFRSMPYSLEEAAKIDGASYYMIFFKVMLPLAMPVVAVIALYYAVQLWNDYFNALIYLKKRTLYPLQLILREILIQNNTASMQSITSGDDAQAYAENVKYATIVVSTVPILCFYPFVQKFFVKGVMIGAVKG